MADLKAGSTVGGNIIWTQGNFPLFPNGEDILYKKYKFYTEYNKPQAIDNDFVSKKDGGSYTGGLTINHNDGLTIGGGNTKGYFAPGNGDNATQATCNVDIKSHWGLGFKDNQNTRRIWFDTRAGSATFTGSVTVNGQVYSLVQPNNVSSLTRKDYVDNNITIVTDNANSRVLRAGDTMTGNLTALGFYSTSKATKNDQVPRLDQVIQKGVSIDFGTY